MVISKKPTKQELMDLVAKNSALMVLNNVMEMQDELKTHLSENAGDIDKICESIDQILKNQKSIMITEFNKCTEG
jgi:hypothetical protein